MPWKQNGTAGELRHLFGANDLWGRITRRKAASSSVPFRTPQPSEAIHPSHGEGSGWLPTFAGISASGSIRNVARAATSYSFEPSGHSGFEFEKPRPTVRLRVAPVTRRTRNCSSPRTPGLLAGDHLGNG
jgi:hypothetical protein